MLAGIGRLSRVIRQFVEVEASHGRVEVGPNHAHPTYVLVHLNKDEQVVCLEIHFVSGSDCLGHHLDDYIPGHGRMVPDVGPYGKLFVLD